ncbi:MAG: 1-deoxy-D-xylulose 5-phosphate reductoisomerase [Firmicutes bacterium]|nr:1-deoxy-D-xylulose 5-phosphate reductoisomerase [Bacillota bacterium]
MKKIIVLGSTGSIGKATLDVALKQQQHLQVVGLAGGQQCQLLMEQVAVFRPQSVAVQDIQCAQRLRALYPDLVIYSGQDAATELVRETPCDVVVAAISGMAGLGPVVAAAERGRVIALANKESLVAAGDLLMTLAKQHGAAILPVDSEHSALWQAMLAWPRRAVRKLILTASGGPFFGRSKEELQEVTVSQALAHPTWKMGGKISIDSATLMNKGLEVIEAHHLFEFSYDDIEVLVHPESIVHSLVEFVDGAQMAQCSYPDMRLPIQLALSFPERWPADYVTNHYAGTSWSFSAPDLSTFRCLSLAIEAGRRGGAYPTVLNAANEVAVASFLRGETGFLAIAEVVETVLAKQMPKKAEVLSEVFAIDEWARRQTATTIKQRAV